MGWGLLFQVRVGDPELRRETWRPFGRAARLLLLGAFSNVGMRFGSGARGAVSPWARAAYGARRP